MLLGFFKVFCRINRSRLIVQSSYLYGQVGKTFTGITHLLSRRLLGYSELRGMQKFSASPRLAAYSFENIFLKAIQLRMSAHSPLEALGEIF